MPNKQISHDASYKAFFSNKEMVRSLFQDFVPESFAGELDFSTLKLCPASYIAPDLEARHDDLVWKLRWRDSWCYIFVLLEFQSSPDSWMGLRISTYTSLLWQALIRAGEIRWGHKLPPVFPMVIYNGDRPWHCASNTRDLVSWISPAFEDYQISQRYYILDIQRIPKDKLDNAKGLCALIFGIECARNEADLCRWIEKIKNSVSRADFDLIKKEFGLWLEQFLAAREIAIKPEIEIESLDMLQERIKEWAQNHINEGIEIGLEKGIGIGREEGIGIGREEGIGIGREEGIGIGRLAGQKDSLRNILELKFGEVPSAWQTRISALDSEKLVNDLIAGAFICQDYSALENYLNKLAG